jgi:two-component system response regulator AtoC
MGAELQAKVLRVLERQSFYPVGAEHPRTTHARVIAATHRPLEELVRNGVFREDLYFRLKVVQIDVPALRERKGDVPDLTQHLMAKICKKLHQDVTAISPEVVRALQGYDWPGNVRELENALTRAAVLARGPVIGIQHVTLGSLEGDGTREAGDPVGDSLEAVEAAHVRRILERTGGNKRQAARVLGISRPRLDRIMKKYDLITPE